MTGCKTANTTAGGIFSRRDNRIGGSRRSASVTRLAFVVAVSTVFAALARQQHGAEACRDVVVSNLHLFVEGEEFWMKGMCYSPTPLGLSNNTGLCSFRLSPYGEWKSNCFDSDWVDGSLTNYRDPPGPPRGWFHDVWTRDLANMAAAGVNTIRLYSTDPTTQLASMLYNGTHSIIAWGTGKEHVTFMDAALSVGIKVIFPLVSDCTLYQTLDNDTLQWLLRNQIDEIGNHSALLMYQIGNEIQFCSNWQSIAARMGWAVSYARSYQLQKWSRNIPFTTSTVYVEPDFETLLQLMPVDVFGVNSYEGSQGSFTMPGLYSYYHPLACTYQVPLFIGEYNPEGYADAGTFYPAGVPTYMHDFITNSDSTGIVGAAFFEWNDEPSKGAYGMLGLYAVSVGVSDGQTSVDTNSWVIDTFTPYPVALNSVVNGTYNGVPWNYQSDVFAKMGRQPYTLSNVPQVCAGVARQVYTASSFLPCPPPEPIPLSTITAASSLIISSTMATTSSTVATTTGVSASIASSTSLTSLTATTGPATATTLDVADRTGSGTSDAARSAGAISAAVSLALLGFAFLC